MIRKIFGLLLGILYISFTGWSQNLNPMSETEKTAFLKKLSEINAQTNSLECPFIQKKSLSVLAETMESKGTMYYAKPDKLRWQYETPYVYIFILNGSQVFVKNDARTDQFNTSSNKLFREISELMVGSVNGAMLTDTKRFTSVFEQDDKTIRVILTPKSKELKQLMSTIVITFSKSSCLVETILMNEQGGDNTLIEFTRNHVNQAIPDNLFIIK